MSGNEGKNKLAGYYAMPRSMHSTRTRSVIPDRAKKSSSAVSTRTYSRMARGGFLKTGDSEVLNDTTSGNENSSQLNESYTDLEELRNEKELLDRMLEQQKQLQELKERQRRVLLLQQQLADVEASAEESLEGKLDKLQTAKLRLDELQQLVSTIKSAEFTGKEGGDQTHQIPDKATRVKKALQELNDLKDMIGRMGSGSDSKESSRKKPAATVEPVFPNVVETSAGVATARNAYDDDYQPALPEVSLIQHKAMEDNSLQMSLKSPKKKSKDLSHHATNAYLPYQKPNHTSTTKKKAVSSKYQEKEPEDLEATLRLFEEMSRHQKLLQELKERRKELETLMNMTNGSELEPEQEMLDEDDYNDENASVGSNIGSDDGDASDVETNDLEANQSGQLFGLSEVDTRRVIDLIRNQKAIGVPTTDKTTATWGSSSSGSDDEVDQLQSMPDSSKPIRNLITKSRNDSAMGTSVKDAFTQINYNKEHEIDFRPPTRRRRNITQPEARNKSLDIGLTEIDINKVQEELYTSNSAMHILLEDQQALSKLLLNTLALQRSAVSSKMCYGISPDFLIYQLDNCSAQFAALLKEVKDLQWQLYSMTKDNDNAVQFENGPVPRNPLATLPYVLNQQSTNHTEPSGMDSFQLRIPSPRNEQPGLLDDSTQVLPAMANSSYARVQKEVDNAEADLFEALRDSIYSEAAILISQNESRPHFLVELFHTLQQLDTDFLRQHALYALQDVVKGYLPNSPRQQVKLGRKRNVAISKKKMLKRASFSENTPSESDASSEDEAYDNMKQKTSNTSKYDFALKISSASELSTPSDDDIAPFAADDLGSTVIHLDAALRHMREVERLKQELKNSDTPTASPGNSRKLEIPSVNTKMLRVWIKNIVSEIIPILKANHDKLVDKKLVKKMHKKVFQCVAKDMTGDNLERGEASDLDKVGIGEFFACQLKSILDDCFSKFIGQRVGSCGEDVIVGLSEVLFNELAFFHMMQDLGKENHAAANGGGDVSTAFENSTHKTDVTESNPSSGTSTKDDEKNEDSEVSNVDDGEVALETGSARNTSSRGSPDPVIIDLSVSETKPLTSYGSGEDEEDGSGDDYDYKEPEIRTSMQQNSDSAVKGNDSYHDDVSDTKTENLD